MNRYTLIGSKTSPYVRRLRMVMKDLDINFKEVMIFDPEQREELKKITPIIKIPVLQVEQEEGDPLNIFESRIIFNYLNKNEFKKEISIDDENILSVIDGINDAFVNLVLMKRSGMKWEEDNAFVKAQRERATEGFGHLAALWTEDHKWDYPAISLYCLLDWAIFRELTDIHEWPVLERFWHFHKNDVVVMATNPRSV